MEDGRWKGIVGSEVRILMMMMTAIRPTRRFFFFSVWSFDLVCVCVCV